MLLKELNLQNFQCFSSETIEFPRFGTSSILGQYSDNEQKSNGAGKSTILESILYALFGKSRTVSESDLVKQGCNGDMTVQITFIFNNQEYIVKRGRTKSGSPILFFSVDGNPLGGGIRDIDQQIIKSLGMTQEVFCATVFFEQNKIDNFTVATSSKRKEYLSSILNLEVYEKCNVAAKQLRDQLTINLSKTQGIIQNLTKLKTDRETLDNHDFTIKKNEEKKVQVEEKIVLSKAIVEEVSRSIIKFEEDLKSSSDLISQLAKLKNQYNGKLGSIEKIKRDIESKKISLKSQWDNKNLLAKQLPEFEKKKEDLNLEISKIIVKSNVEAQITKDKVSQFRQEQGEASGDIKRLKAEINSVVSLGANCPTCKQNIDQDMVAALTKEKNNNIELQQLALDGLKGMLDTLIEEQRVDDKSRALVSELKSQLIRTEGEITLSSNAKKERDEIQIQGKEQIDSFESSLISANEELKEYETQYSEMQERVNKISTPENSGLNSLKAVFEMRKREVVELEYEIKKCEENIFRAKNHIEEIEKLKKQIETESASIQERQLELQAYQDLSELFSQKGIPAIIIENTIQEIEVVTNEYLSELGSIFKVRLLTQKQTKTGDMRETLDILIELPEGVRDYNTYSGGEKTIINLCLRLALSTVLSSRNKVHFDSIFLDEVVSALDTENRENFLKLIKILSNKFSQIFIISHIQEMADVFDHSIRVIKSSSGSKVLVER